MSDTAAAIVTAGPNPPEGELTVASTTPLASVALYNLNGALMAGTDCAGADSATLDLSHMPAGMYILNVNDSAANRSVFKIIKK